MIECETCRNQPPLCDQCVARNADSLSGVALSRGILWAESVTRRMPTKRADRSWPRWNESERVRMIARSKVNDLTRDERLIERLAKLCADSAHERFGKPSSILGGVSFVVRKR